MTWRIQTRPLPDFAVDAAENEGMPVPDVDNRAERGPRHGRMIGTLRLRHVKSRTVSRPHRADPAVTMTGRRTPKSRPQSRPITRMIMLAGALASLAFPALAQDGTGAVPDNAAARGQGAGWDCDIGFRADGATCREIAVPENAFATGLPYGTGWTCRRGYTEVDRTSCDPIPVPPDAFLQSSGRDWQCDRGFRRAEETCVPIVLPPHAYLSEEWSGPGWACDRGFSAEADRCVPIAVPENGYLTNANYGDAWACERGFREIDGRCEPVTVPANAFLDPKTYGPGWRCERGFEPVGNTCIAIDLPENSHLDHSGNRWSCDNGFQPSGGACTLRQ